MKTTITFFYFTAFSSEENLVVIQRHFPPTLQQFCLLVCFLAVLKNCNSGRFLNRLNVVQILKR